MKKVEIDRKFDEIVDFSGVEKFLDTPVKRYSSGMKVRLAFAIAAHLEPEILLVDEVLAVGDVYFQKKCMTKMQDVGQHGRTIIFVSHNMPAITRLCERAILIEEGRIVEDGPSSQVVGTYMSSGVSASTSRKWRDPTKAPGGHVARLNLVRVCQADVQVVEEVDMDRPIEIEMVYEVLEPGHVLLPHFALWTEYGQLAFVTLENEPAWRRTPRPKGRYLSMVSIPANFLNDGMYYVNCHCLVRNPDRLEFTVPSAISFYVSDSFGDDSARGDYAGPLEGVLRPFLNWTTELI
jgi:lipopolysaccharide transport system ATP-binding protein